MSTFFLANLFSKSRKYLFGADFFYSHWSFKKLGIEFIISVSIYKLKVQWVLEHWEESFIFFVALTSFCGCPKSWGLLSYLCWSLLTYYYVGMMWFLTIERSFSPLQVISLITYWLLQTRFLAILQKPGLHDIIVVAYQRLEWVAREFFCIGARVAIYNLRIDGP